MCSKHSETADVGVDAKRPEEWDVVLYQNEKELARVNYEQEEARHKFLTEKAKVIFVVVALVLSLVLSKLDAVIPVFTVSPVWIKWPAFFCFVVLMVTLGVAVILALTAIRPRERKAAARCQDFVDKLSNSDKATIERSVACLYQSAADVNGKINEELAKYVGSALKWVTGSFFIAMLFVLLYVIYAANKA